MSNLSWNEIQERVAEFPDSSLADLYDPLTMPPKLSHSHHHLDRYIDRLYLKSGFTSDADRVAHLFDLCKDIVNE